MLVPVRQGKHKVVAVLRSVTLMDATFSEVSRTLDITQQTLILHRKQQRHNWPRCLHHGKSRRRDRNSNERWATKTRRNWTLEKNCVACR